VLECTTPSPVMPAPGAGIHALALGPGTVVDTRAGRAHDGWGEGARRVWKDALLSPVMPAPGAGIHALVRCPGCSRGYARRARA